ncbi:hypothetical protein F4561_002214 [Lipingzhangella halophila]|uniref:Uncharacterized protein n=1 Tax=Lipingzhangella halophila TaxID=1783352 RepID=A0A7W7W333_9ACTN|nr:hypothetical protein [Lipingzhangella halophila]MBB4931394.1 hypothetical protein [Lipingzhangella halophila]
MDHADQHKQETKILAALSLMRAAHQGDDDAINAIIHRAGQAGAINELFAALLALAEGAIQDAAEFHGIAVEDLLTNTELSVMTQGGR